MDVVFSSLSGNGMAVTALADGALGLRDDHPLAGRCGRPETRVLESGNQVMLLWMIVAIGCGSSSRQGNVMEHVVRLQKAGMPRFAHIANVCVGAAQARPRDRRYVLIEATCNQVNQFGGYTGMKPANFQGCPAVGQRWVSPEAAGSGGDHGPNRGREPAGLLWRSRGSSGNM